MADLLRRIMCYLFNQCSDGFVKRSDPLFIRYGNLDSRVNRLEREWRPRDLLDIE